MFRLGQNIFIKDGIIVEENKGQKLSIAAETLLLPGFLDIHNHGAVGHDVNNATAQELLVVAGYLANNGVTSWLPTLVPDSDENYRKAIGEIEALMTLQTGKAVAQAVGVHYEGVFAAEKMCGALRSEFFKKYAGREVDELPRLKSGVHMITLAPETDGGIDAIAELVKQGWVVSIGHTNADVATLDKAFAAGARHMTHFFNAMAGLHHRTVGAVGWGLSNDEVTFDIIADGIHVDPKIVSLACRAKSTGKVSIISDSVAPTGMGDGIFDLWGERITVGNGRTQNERGSIAGSVSTMLDGVTLLMELGFTNEDIAKMTSRNPAHLLGLSDRGTIEIGQRADLVGIDPDGSVVFVMVAGQILEE